MFGKSFLSINDTNNKVKIQAIDCEEVFETLIHFSYSKRSTVVSPCGLSFNFNKNVIDD